MISNRGRKDICYLCGGNMTENKRRMVCQDCGESYPLEANKEELMKELYDDFQKGR